MSAGDKAPANHLGSCHCGKVRVELLVDISTLEVKEDNCSSCVRVRAALVFHNRYLPDWD